MKVTERAWAEYIAKMARISQKAADLMQEWIEQNGTENRKAMLDYAMALTQHYGEAIGSLSCQMYEKTAEAQGAVIEPAEPAPIPNYGEMAKAVNGTMKQSEKLVPSTVGRLVKQVGADTTLNNAIRDRTEAAWVPYGDTCAFCITLASRGWQPVSRKTLKNGHAEHIHANCDCQYAVRFDGKSNIAGYDPEIYRKMYYGAGEGSPQDKINALRRQLREKEDSNKRLKSLDQNTLVDIKAIKSSRYRRLIDQLTGDAKESREVHKATVEILEHRNGTRYEDLAYIDSKTGKIIVNKDYDYYENGISSCKPNKPMVKLLEDAESKTIIAVHNHPGSSTPSFADIISASKRGYKYGMVVCHNGTIYKYSLTKDIKQSLSLEFMLDKLNRAKYNGDNEGIANAIEALGEMGVKIEVV